MDMILEQAEEVMRMLHGLKDSLGEPEHAKT